MGNIATDLVTKMEQENQEMLDKINKSNEEQYQEGLKRHNEIVSELQNIVAAVKDLTELIRNTR